MIVEAMLREERKRRKERLALEGSEGYASDLETMLNDLCDHLKDEETQTNCFHGNSLATTARVQAAKKLFENAHKRDADALTGSAPESSPWYPKHASENTEFTFICKQSAKSDKPETTTASPAITIRKGGDYQRNEPADSNSPKTDETRSITIHDGLKDISDEEGWYMVIP